MHAKRDTLPLRFCRIAVFCAPGRRQQPPHSHEADRTRSTVHFMSFSWYTFCTLIRSVMSFLSANSSAPRPGPGPQRRPEASPRPEPPARLCRLLPLHLHPRCFHLVGFLQRLSRRPANRPPAKTFEKAASVEARCLEMGARTWRRLKEAPRHRDQGARVAGLRFRVRVGYGWNARRRS